MKLLMSIAIALSLIGCVSSAGPFVTNVTPGPHGTMAVERCTVRFYHYFFSWIDKDSCKTTQTAPAVQAPSASAK